MVSQGVVEGGRGERRVGRGAGRGREGGREGKDDTLLWGSVIETFQGHHGESRGGGGVEEEGRGIDVR